MFKESLTDYLPVEAKCVGLYEEITRPDNDSQWFGTGNGVQVQLVGWATRDTELLALYTHIQTEGEGVTEVKLLIGSIAEGMREAIAEHDRLVAAHPHLRSRGSER